MPSDDVDPGKYKEMPYNMQKMVKAIGFPEFSNLDPEEAEVYERVRNGYCMTCGGVLRKDANFIVSRFGIVGGYCSGVCHSDMAVMGFLQQTHDELTGQIELRGQGIEPSDPDPVDTSNTPDSLGDDPATRDVEE